MRSDRPQDAAAHGWPRMCDSPGCGRTVSEFGRLRHRECPPPRFITCTECGHVFEGLAMFVDHYRRAPDGSGRTMCEAMADAGEEPARAPHRSPVPIVLVHSRRVA